MSKLLLLYVIAFATFHLAYSKYYAPRSIRRHIVPSRSRIIGGEEVEPHSIPFQAGLDINGNAFCGGSLISTTYVITAGHCGEVIRRVNVILGAHDITNDNEETRQTIAGDSIIIHENYDTETLHNDITLIHLVQEAILNNFVAVTPLPARGDADDQYTNKLAIASGWGLAKDVPFPTTSDLSPVLLSVEVAIMNTTECGLYYNDEDGDYVIETNVCTTGYRNKGTCNGDSGGPLTIDGLLVGLTSFGTELCETCAPSVYTRVASYLDWIAQNSDVIIN